MLLQQPLYTKRDSRYDPPSTSQVTYNISTTEMGIHNIIEHNRELYCPSNQA